MTIETSSGTVVEHRLIVIGSSVDTIFPRDIPLYFRDGIVIDRRNNTPMEMNAYGLYLGFRALETMTKADYQTERREIVEAVIKRMQSCGGFWSHGAITGSYKEVHMRFTAAAIRLLVEAFGDGIISNSSTIVGALKKHLSFSERLTFGTWFFHDSIEQYSLEECSAQFPTWTPPMRSIVWGSSNGNCLVLNTHIDTLITILQVLRRIELDDEDRQFLLTNLYAGLVALKTVLSPSQNVWWRCFNVLDSVIRSILFRTFSSKSLLARIPRGRGLVKRLILALYFPFRPWLKSRTPGFAFSDGYLERDIGLRGETFEYHIGNVWDLAKFLAQVKDSDISVDTDLVKRCEELVDRGIEYTIRTPYWNHLVESMRHYGVAIVFCEAILARLSTKHERDIPKHWVDCYCSIRQSLSPSPAIFGYDPLVVGHSGPKTIPTEGSDVVCLRSGGTLLIDFAHKKFVIESCPTAPAGGAT